MADDSTPSDSAEQRARAHEPHDPGVAGRLNALRAAVLGANDGIVSTAGIVIGVAAAGAARGEIFTAGLAGLTAGAMSMAVGEYVSVSTQRDTEKALLDKERTELATMPVEEMAELAGLYEKKGLSRELAREVAEQLHAHDALAAHAEVELNIDPEELTNPWQAAFASMVAFTVGALIPLLAILLAPEGTRTVVTVVAVIIALLLTGWVSAKLGDAPRLRAMLRVAGGGALAMAVTYLIGLLFGTAVA